MAGLMDFINRAKSYFGVGRPGLGEFGDVVKRTITPPTQFIKRYPTPASYIQKQVIPRAKANVMSSPAIQGLRAAADKLRSIPIVAMSNRIQQPTQDFARQNIIKPIKQNIADIPQSRQITSNYINNLRTPITKNNWRSRGLTSMPLTMTPSAVVENKDVLNTPTNQLNPDQQKKLAGLQANTIMNAGFLSGGLVNKGLGVAKQLVKADTVEKVKNIVSDVSDNVAQKIAKSKSVSEISNLIRKPTAPSTPKAYREAGEEILSSADKAILQRVRSSYSKGRQFTKAIADRVRKGQIDPDSMGYRWSQMKAEGKTLEEIASDYVAGASEAGKTLGEQSFFLRKLRATAPDVYREINNISKAPPTTWEIISDTFNSNVNNIRSIWKSALVSQPSTAMANFDVAALIEYPLKVSKDFLYGVVKTISGKEAPAVAFSRLAEDFGSILRTISRSPQRKWVLDQLEKNPSLASDYHQLYYADTPAGELTNKISRGLTVFNRLQEFAVRNTILDAYVSGALRRLLGGAKPTSEALSKIDPKVVQRTLADALNDGVELSLKLTYASQLKNKFAKKVVEAVNHNPLIGWAVETGGYAFPRFLASALNRVFEVSPAGLLRLATDPKLNQARQGISVLKKAKPTKANLKAIGMLQDKILEKTHDIVSEAIVGTMGIWAALEYRKQSDPDQKWYEMKIGDEYIDVRRYGPVMPSWLLLAEAALHPEKLSVKDYIEGISGIRRLPANSLITLSFLEGATPETFAGKAKEFVGNIIGGFTTPFRGAKDLIGGFSEPERTMRYTRENPILGPAIANIPFLNRMLPASPDMTQEGPVVTEHPWLRQLLGATIYSKNKIQKEIDALGINIYSLIPKEGDPKINRLIQEGVSKLVNKISPTLDSLQYQSLSAWKKKEVISEAFSDLKKEVKGKVIDDYGPEFVNKLIDRLKGQSDKKIYAEFKKKKDLLSGKAVEALVGTEFYQHHKDIISEFITKNSESLIYPEEIALIKLETLEKPKKWSDRDYAPYVETTKNLLNKIEQQKQGITDLGDRIKYTEKQKSTLTNLFENVKNQTNLDIIFKVSDELYNLYEQQKSEGYVTDDERLRIEKKQAELLAYVVNRQQDLWKQLNYYSGGGSGWYSNPKKPGKVIKQKGYSSTKYSRPAVKQAFYPSKLNVAESASSVAKPKTDKLTPITKEKGLYE